MTRQADPPLSPQAICSAFVGTYYTIVHETPEQAYKFYKDASTIGWARPDGVVEYATTLTEINQKLSSTDFSKYFTEIESADAVSSHNGGVLIVVIGSSTTADDVCQKFTQSFFLAPQDDGGYFILSDILRITSNTPRLAISQSDSQENEIKRNAGSIVESREAERVKTDHVAAENKAGDLLEVVNPTANGTTYENYDDMEPPVQVTKEDIKGIDDASSLLPQPRKDATSSFYASIVTSLFSRLLNVRG